MNEEEIYKMINTLELHELKNYFIVPANQYDVSTDDRLLIPIMRYQKYGFVDKEAMTIIEPKYDIINGDFYTCHDLVKVGIRYSVGFPKYNGEIKTYERYKWGVINAKGETLIEPLYYDIVVTDDRSPIVVRKFSEGYGVLNIHGNIIVPVGSYHYMDGFTNGYARVCKNDKWGIINEKGEVVLPLEYDSVWKFYGKPELQSTKVVKDNKIDYFVFNTGRLKCQNNQ